MKLIRIFLSSIIVLVYIPFSIGAHSNTPVFVQGNIDVLFADPSDIVFTLKNDNKKVIGPCGSPFFHIQRTNINFNEFYSLILTAFAANKVASLYVSNCSADRNILSHGYVNQ